ncbi:MAG: alternative ribosome rescue aminoacyl-tRNA hydrolase ArfB [Candidatus Wenzhouxiangella sp. M2_3B_020]
MSPSAFDHPKLPPENELEEKFVLGGGPGGQHVNRSATAVQLRFDVRASSFLSGAVKKRLLELAGNRADSGGVITIEARTHRSQFRNREEARERLAELIERASRPTKRRLKTRPTRSAKKKRLRQKRRRGEIKRKRAKPAPDE